MLIRWLKSLSHKHTYVKIGFQAVEDRHERYSMRQYQCQSCSKTKWVDGRTDTN
jgi:hypothetical protein